MTLASLALLLTALPADVTLFEPTGPAVGNVRIVDETGARADRFPPALQGVELRPLERVGRTAWTVLVPGEARRRTELPGAARLALPGDAGTLYGYRRPGTPDAYGLFLVDASGAARVLLERPGSGPLEADPFGPKLALDDDASHVLVATSVAAGGDLLEVELATGTVVDRTALLPPLELAASGLALLGTWGVAVTPDELLRFDRTPGAQASAVGFGGGVAARASLPAPLAGELLTLHPDWIGDDLARSADGTTVAFLAGPDPLRAFVFTLRATGSAWADGELVLAPSGGGFLPEALDGPTLAVAPDGSAVAWRTEDGSGETFVGAATAPRTVQITEDASFADTLNDSGVITFLSPDELVVLVGEADDGDAGQIDAADLYHVDLAAPAAPGITNLSGTSGDLVLPFDASGLLDTGDGLHLRPDGTGALGLARSGGVGDLLAIGFAATTDVLVGSVKSLDLVATVAGETLFAVRRDAPEREELYRLRPGATAAELLASLTGEGYRGHATRGAVFTAVFTDAAGSDLLGRATFPGGDVELLVPAVPTLGPTLAVTADGSVAFSMDGGGGTVYALWNPGGGAAPFASSTSPGFLLP